MPRFGQSHEKVTIKQPVMKLPTSKKVLGVHLDSELSFDHHISETCKKNKS